MKTNNPHTEKTIKNKAKRQAINWGKIFVVYIRKG
jgi:hypothetical protein